VQMFAGETLKCEKSTVVGGAGRSYGRAGKRARPESVPGNPESRSQSPRIAGPPAATDRSTPALFTPRGKDGRLEDESFRKDQTVKEKTFDAVAVLPLCKSAGKNSPVPMPVLLQNRSRNESSNL
jgi:hypothetical protein